MKDSIKRQSPLALQYFAEGASGEGGGEAGTGESGTDTAASPGRQEKGRYRNIQSAKPGHGDAQGAAQPSRSRENESQMKLTPKYRNIQKAGRGKEASAAGEEGAHKGNEVGVQDTLEAEFEGLIKGKYREAWQKRADAIVNRRFAELKALRESQSALHPLMDRLSRRYNRPAGDIQGTLNALDGDQPKTQASVPGSVEDRRVMTLDQKVREARLEQMRGREQEMRAERRQRIDNIHNRWQEETKEAVKVHPGFDFHKETQNPDFTKLITAGIPVLKAYEVIHRDEVLGGAMSYTAQKVREKLARDIALRGMRPAENGASGQTAMVPGFRYERLSKAAKSEIERRALRGERINPRDYMDYK